MGLWNQPHRGIGYFTGGMGGYGGFGYGGGYGGGYGNFGPGGYNIVQGRGGIGGYWKDTANASIAQGGGGLIRGSVFQIFGELGGLASRGIHNVFHGGDDDYPPQYVQQRGYAGLHGRSLPQVRGFGVFTNSHASYVQGGTAGQGEEGPQSFEDFVAAKEASAAQEAMKIKKQIDALDDPDGKDKDAKAKLERKAELAANGADDTRQLLVEYLSTKDAKNVFGQTDANKLIAKVAKSSEADLGGLKAEIESRSSSGGAVAQSDHGSNRSMHHSSNQHGDSRRDFGMQTLNPAQMAAVGNILQKIDGTGFWNARNGVVSVNEMEKFRDKHPEQWDQIARALGNAGISTESNVMLPPSQMLSHNGRGGNFIG